MICASYDAHLEVQAEAKVVKCRPHNAPPTSGDCDWQLSQTQFPGPNMSGQLARPSRRMSHEQRLTAQEMWADKDAAEKEIEKEAANVARASLVITR